MYAKTDKPEHLSEFTMTQNIKVDKSQCSLRPKQCSLKQKITMYVKTDKHKSLNIKDNKVC